MSAKYNVRAIKHFARNHDKNAENAIFFGHVMRAHQSMEENIMLRNAAGARKKGKNDLLKYSVTLTRREQS